MRPITISDREELKAIVLDVLRRHPEILKSAIEEVLRSSATEVQEPDEKRREYIKALILEDFQRYSDVFKKLA